MWRVGTRPANTGTRTRYNRAPVVDFSDLVGYDGGDVDTGVQFTVGDGWMMADESGWAGFVGRSLLRGIAYAVAPTSGHHKSNGFLCKRWIIGSSVCNASLSLQ